VQAAENGQRRKRCVDEIARMQCKGTTDWRRRDAVRLEDQVMMNSLSAHLIRFDNVAENHAAAVYRSTHFSSSIHSFNLQVSDILKNIRQCNYKQDNYRQKRKLG